MAPLFAQWQHSACITHFSVINLGLGEQIAVYGIHLHGNTCFGNIHYFTIINTRNISALKLCPIVLT